MIDNRLLLYINFVKLAETKKSRKQRAETPSKA